MTRVSVILPVFNGATTIEKALLSLSEQTMGDFEALVIDDGSTDATRQIVENAVQKDARIRLIALDRNYGVSHARNVALDHAQGQWITLLDADDWFDPTRLAVLVEAAHTLDADMVFDNMRLFDETGQRNEFTSDFGDGLYPKPITAQSLFAHDTPYVRFAMGYAQPMIRAAFLRTKGIRYNESYALGEDFVFMADILLHGGTAFAIGVATYNYRYALSPAFAGQENDRKVQRGYEQVLDACDNLLARFGEGLADDVRNALERRRGLFATLLLTRQIKGQLLRGEVGGAFVAIARAPRVIPFICHMAAFRLMRQASLLFPFLLG